ncbi:MAG: GtrA family protein, partial [Armatimonadota bacterium]|nr:GtrA family protein [Armatimonadota bacterium]
MRTELSQVQSRQGAWLAYLVYRHRYFFGFVSIGFLSILLEIALIQKALPSGWPWSLRVLAGFACGLLFSFVGNTFFNFKVQRQYFFRTLLLFGTVSIISFAVNMAAVTLLRSVLGDDYAVSRIVTTGMFFLIFYGLHRRYTFDMARNFGLALYVSEAENVQHAFARVGPNCDHLHMDLIDTTMKADASPVNVERIDQARSLWPRLPVCLHVMSQTPARWVEATWDKVDWYLFHVQSDDDLMELIFECRRRKKKVGVVWQRGITARDLMPYLPHIDYLMILGIAVPGQSGQKMCEEALAAANTLADMRKRYGYNMIFDGGVTVDNVGSIPATYI